MLDILWNVSFTKFECNFKRFFNKNLISNFIYRFVTHKLVRHMKIHKPNDNEADETIENPPIDVENDQLDQSNSGQASFAINLNESSSSSSR